MNEPLIEFRNVTKTFGSNIVLNKVNLKIQRGEITTIIGKSGMGKTVILKHIIGLMEPDSGKILFNSKDIWTLNPKERIQFRFRVGYLFQNVALFDSMNVYDNIALPLRENTELTEMQIRAKVISKMEKLEIVEILEKHPSEISGGMKKRVGLARVLVMDPEVILFDEPTTGLDPIRKNAVHSMISHMQRKIGFTGVMVSHEIPDVFYISQKIVMLDNGIVIADCSPKEIENVDHPKVKEFIQGAESLKDELTGLQTKKRITNQFVEELMYSLHKPDSYCSVLLFKINGLDKINEALGFVTGQKVIQHFASFIEHYLRISGKNSRYSDDLILTLLPNTKLGIAKILIGKLEEAMKHYPPLPSEGFIPMNYSISSSVVEIRDHQDIESVVTLAEKNLSVIGYFELK
jgi:phospholipid/cholesterol/gamma-HCH transport system ATP-binding protein